MCAETRSGQTDCIPISERMLKRWTLTNLYDALVHYREDVKGKVRSVSQWEREVKGFVTLDLIEELDHVHCYLDPAVLGAFGRPVALGDDEILERLLALNLKRVEAQK